MSEWKPTEEMIARGEAFRGECFSVDYNNPINEDTLAETMREREKWYKAGWQGRKRYETEIGLIPVEIAELSALRAGSNYIADDDTFPSEIRFANGRKVGIAFDGAKPYLTISGG